MADDIASVPEAVRLEHRLTKMEQAMVANTDATVQMAERLRDQNGRIGKLERFSAQLLVLGLMASIVSPLIFGVILWALDRAYGGG